MIAFSKLGNYGRLGNQLFQYAFLRVTARRLGTTFYCPRWEGDDIFDLADEGERAPAPVGITGRFGPTREAGFTPQALAVRDGTDIEGFFQSDRYYPDRAAVRGWYTFKSPIAEAVHARYGVLVGRGCASVSVRLDDDYGATREYFPLYPLGYYERALRLAGVPGPVLVFADRADRARSFFQPLRGYDLEFVEGLTPPAQLYLMTRCRANVITNSTFAWWGAWLNTTPGRTVVAPSSWNRPGVPNPVNGILSDEWTLVRGTRPVWDNFHVWRFRHPVATLRRAWAKATGPKPGH